MPVYKIYGIYPLFSNDVLYVGITKKLLRKRYKQHVAYRRSLISQYIRENGGARRYYIGELHRVYELYEGLEWERHLIMELDPPYNVRHKQS
jgi:excinuclease UvrABC nuclease subunit